MQVRDRDLGRRDQVQLVAGDDVHLVFLVRDLPVPVAEAVLTTAGGQISTKSFSCVWTSRNQEMSERCRADPAPL